MQKKVIIKIDNFNKKNKQEINDINKKVDETINNSSGFNFLVNSDQIIYNIGKEKDVNTLITTSSYFDNQVENKRINLVPKNTKNSELSKEGLPNTSTEAIININVRLKKVDNWESRITSVESLVKQAINDITIINTQINKNKVTPVNASFEILIIDAQLNSDWLTIIANYNNNKVNILKGEYIIKRPNNVNKYKNACWFELSKINNEYILQGIISQGYTSTIEGQFFEEKQYNIKTSFTNVLLATYDETTIRQNKGENNAIIYRDINQEIYQDEQSRNILITQLIQLDKKPDGGIL